MKNKVMKLFLILGVILFSLVCVSCNQLETRENDVNVSYVGTYFSDEEAINGQFYNIERKTDLIDLLKVDIPEKYDVSFFETNSLLVFKIIEASKGTNSKIESYNIEENYLTVYVETTQFGENCSEEHWWFVLELRKDESDAFQNVKIMKDNVEIMNDYKNNIYNEAIKCYFEKYVKPNRSNASIEDVWLFKYLGTYNDSFVGIFLDKENCIFPEEELTIEVEGVSFSYSYGYDILVYYGGQFYTLDKAYENKILSKLDLNIIYNRYYNLE